MEKFIGLFWTQFLGAFNDNFFKNALVILITYQATQVGGLSPQEMVALSGGIFILPFFLFSSLAGQVADRYSKSNLTRFIKLAEICIMTFGAVGFLTNQIEFLLMVLFLMGAQSAFFGPIKYSILPQLLDNKNLVKGNALVEMGTFVSILLGTILGGLLINSDQGKLWVSIGVIFFAILGYFASRTIPKTIAQDRKLKISYNFFSQTWKLFTYTRENRKVFYSVCMISWFWGFGAVLLSLFPIYGKDVLFANETIVTFFLALFSLGIGIGSMAYEKISKGQIQVGTIFWSGLAMAVFCFDLFWIGQPKAFAPLDSKAFIGLDTFLSHSTGIRITFDLVMLSIFAGIFIVPLYTIMQKDSLPAHRSRVIAGNNVLNALVMVISSVILTSLLGKNVAVPEVFFLLAIFQVFFVVLIFRKLHAYSSSKSKNERPSSNGHAI